MIWGYKKNQKRDAIGSHFVLMDLNRIEPEAQLFNYQWKNLPVGTQERVKTLIKHKLALDYDPTMVDPKWRK